MHNTPVLSLHPYSLDPRAPGRCVLLHPHSFLFSNLNIISDIGLTFKVSLLPPFSPSSPPPFPRSTGPPCRTRRRPRIPLGVQYSISDRRVPSLLTGELSRLARSLRGQRRHPAPPLALHELLRIVSVCPSLLDWILTTRDGVSHTAAYVNPLPPPARPASPRTPRASQGFLPRRVWNAAHWPTCHRPP